MTFDFTRWPNADELLDEALGLPPSERDSFLRVKAGGDPELLAALQAIESGGETVMGARASRDALATVLAALESSRVGRAVRVS